MNKIIGFFQLIRFDLPFSAGICVIMGQLLAAGIFPEITIILLGFFSVFCISASILVMNDFFDVETDKINAPHRPIPSQKVTPFEALIFSLILMGSGLLLSYLISINLLLLAIALLIIGNLYNRKFKQSGLIGNLMVSFSVGMTFIYGGLSAGFQFNKIVLFFAVIAALIDLGEEIAADAMDMEGDAIIDSQSIAIKYGRDNAIKISTSIFFTVIILSFIPFILEWFHLYYLIPIVIMDLSIAYPAYKLLTSHNDKGRNYIRWIYLGSTFGLIVFLTMRLLSVQI
jgi:geranylgeranylglycerol-phosphate geranylgeranyltransferase